MAIQFPCSGCGNQLSVPDDAGGKKARCPKCSTVVNVPLHPEPSGGDANAGHEEYRLSGPEAQPSYSRGGATTPPKPQPYSDNPYASPTVGYEDFGHKSTLKGAIRPTIIQFEDVFSHAWNLYMQNVGMVLGAVLIVGVVNIVGGQVLQVATSVISQESEEAGLVLALFGQIVLGVFNTFLHIGQTKILLDVARGRQASLGDLFAGGRYLLWVVLGWIAYVIMLYIGLILLIVPAFFVAILFGQFLYLIVDQDMNLGDAFSVSIQLSNGNKMTLFLIYLMGTLILIGATIACVVPVIFFGPYVAFLYVVAYLKLAGQPMARV